MGALVNSPLVDVAIGLAVIWFVTATITSAVVEAIAWAGHWRAKHLWRYLKERLTESGAPKPSAKDAPLLFLNAVQNADAASPLAKFAEGVGITDLKAAGKRIDQLARSDAIAGLLRAMAAPAFAATPAGKVLTQFEQEAAAKADVAGKWFDDHMALATKQYRRNVRKWAVAVGAVVVLLLGVDAVGAGGRLYRDPTTRALTNELAKKAVDDKLLDATCAGSDAGTNPPPTIPIADLRTCAATTAKTLVPLDLLLWQQPHTKWRDLLDWRSGLGLIVSAIAVGAGAPFWFAALKRLMGMRSP
jgi:hypothetical protein